MNNRELLELAAKAAEYKVRWHDRWECFVHAEPHNIDNPPTIAGQRQVWTPLTDDGDALRLAVKLGMNLDVSGGRACALVKELPGSEEPLGDDPYSSMRRAIVREAAEIGRLI